MSSFYSLQQLPPPGLADQAQLVWQVEAKWKQAARVIAGVQNAPVGLGWQLKQQLDNLMVYVRQALNEIDVFYGRGGAGMEPVGNVEGLAFVTQQFLAALPAAQVSAGERAMNSFDGFSGYGDATVSVDTAQRMLDLTRPPSDESIVTGLLVAVGVFALVTALR